MLELATRKVSKKGITSALFDVLNANSILYCHWKSNEHLEGSMQGLMDLDVLFAASQRDRIESLLHQLGFKKFNAIPEKLYKDIVDFLMVDPVSGRVIHLHTHYRLTMGKPYLKGYQFTSDFEQRILAWRVFNETHGLYCIHPAIELALLFIRESLKLRHRDLIPLQSRRKIRNTEYILREYWWLKARTTDEEIEEVVRIFFNNNEAIYRIVSGEFTGRKLRQLSRIIRTENFLMTWYTPLAAMTRRWYREATVVLSRKMSAVLDRPILFKRTNPRGGKIVAIIGADGSGKSTITEDLKKTFETKLDVYKIYFGRGDGKASAGRKLLSSGKSLFKGERKDKAEDKKPGKRGFIRNVYRCLQALMVAHEKKQNLRLMQIARSRRALVICDRFPQNQIMGYNDGPLLSDLSNSRNFILRALARMERTVYAQAECTGPDLLFKLVADAEIVEQRKPGETSPEKLRMKIQGIKGLKFNSAVKVVTVDASKPLNEVLFLIRQEIWKIM